MEAAVGRNLNDGKLVLTHEDYENAGQIEEALSRDAEEAWNKVKSDPKKAQLARRVFLLRCDVSTDEQITRRRPQVSEVIAVTGATVGCDGKIAREFQADDRNFLLPPSDESLTPDTYIEIGHYKVSQHLLPRLGREGGVVVDVRPVVFATH